MDSNLDDNYVKAHVVVKGKVQGVFFRVETQKVARKIGVFGWVKNRSDRNVEAVFEGRRQKVEDVIKWCQKGPQLSNVTDVDVTYEKYTGEFSDFNIDY